MQSEVVERFCLRSLPVQWRAMAATRGKGGIMVQGWGEYARAVGSRANDQGHGVQPQICLRVAHKTDVGRSRVRNEDYIWMDQGAGVFIIADGLGGRAAGDVASRLAATSIGERLATRAATHSKSSLVSVLLTEVIEFANRQVHQAARLAEKWHGMGSTVIVALLRAQVVSISHAGDTRAYLMRDERMVRLTEDHSVVSALIAGGSIDEATAHTHPHRHVVTKMLGQDVPVEPTFTEVTLLPGDWLMLCSDGLWNQVSDATVLATLRQANGDPTYAVEALVAAANEAGGEDNISVVLVRADEGNIALA